ncbi:CxxC_CxxC_SSSS, putative regulatory protein, FmdB family [uncultured Caudovirales phage]|uniref:CxxC_CxxC_SSSS, putative regulatory protein, FmdB family n=1 Tax=uncultured Caudovirales phage TaxID=2100421 RepID=A0A6J7WP31_9CAUD|nr:CxxC_CxxC_SSSS, putative regulatory protein, FmdB family [uncultured Caudovirales phage]CAB5219781.1 CxxC_CxxC_SSSS, putative regulatory protein, FmdB family [uncultured Caudovirales phage]
MPTYQYKCPLCQASLTVTRSIHVDDPGYECDNCKVKMNQVIGNIGLSFKGGGWGSGPN